MNANVNCEYTKYADKTAQKYKTSIMSLFFFTSIVFYLNLLIIYFFNSDSIYFQDCNSNENHS